MMKTISNSILTAFLAVICFASVSAQGNNNNSTYDLLIADATEIIVLCSQISGDVQQLMAFSNNGNSNQLARRVSDINDGMADLNNAAEMMASRPIINRAIAAEVGRLVDATQNRNFDWRQVTNAVNTNNNAAVQDMGNVMRTGLFGLKGLSQEVRQEVTTVKNK